MSLRAQITEAIDEVTPAAPTLERRVRAFVLAETRERKTLRLRRRPSRWMYRLQGAGALFAAAMVVLLVAGLVVGGRLLRPSNPPAPAINQAALEKLERRPLLQLPAMPADGVCPVGPLGTDYIGGPAIGNGKMRSVMGGTPTVYAGDWGMWDATWFLADPLARGLFLVRGRDIVTGKAVYFAGNLSGVPDANIGRAVLAGHVDGEDKVNGQTVPLRPELVANASAPGDFANSVKAPMWGAYVGYQKGGSGCIVFQIDYGGTTETFVRAY